MNRLNDLKPQWSVLPILVFLGGWEMAHHTFENMGLKMDQEVFLILKLRRIKVYEEKAGP